jgi:hypothetical protein
VTETLTLTTSSANADMIGRFASLYISGRIKAGEYTLVIPKSMTWSMEATSDRVRLRPGKDVRVERVGIDVFIEYIDFFPDGSMTVMVKRGPIRFEREVKL